MDLTDAQILQGLSEDNPVVFRAIYEKEWPRILGFILKNKGTQEDAREVISESLLAVYKNITEGKYEGRGNFSAYFFSIAANVWRMKLRKLKRSIQTSDLDEHTFHIAYEGWDELHAKIKDEQLNALYKAMQKMDAMCNDLIRKFHLDGIPLRDIAEAWNITYEAVRKRVFDCRNKLKILLYDEISKEG